MLRSLVLAAILTPAAGCQPESAPVATNKAQPKGRLQELAKANSKFVGYLYTVEQPAISGRFSDGMLQWRSDPQSHAIVQGRADVFTWPTKSCLGFEQKNLFMPKHGPERYLVCEAVEPFNHRNNLPRSQDFSFQRGNIFLEYQPPQGTGYAQVYYLAEQK